MPSVTITMTRYAEPDSLLRQVLEHALRQQGVEGEVLLVEQRTDRPFDGAGPQTQVRIYRIFNHYRNIYAP